ncbi:Zinc finger CCCH domain-containing 45, partial [Hyphodiscus hymeniophilus]
MNSRAAELKAQLLKQRGRASSPTPPTSMTSRAGRPQPNGEDASSSLHGSPQTPATTTETSDLNELISEFANQNTTKDTQMKDANDNIKIQLQRPLTIPADAAKSQVLSSGSPTKVTKPHIVRVVENGINTKNTERKHASSGSMSEGEIFEDRAIMKALPSAEPIAQAINQKDPAPRNPRDEQASKPQRPGFQGRRIENDPRQDRRATNHTDERRPYPSESIRSPRQRQGERDDDDDDHRSEVRSDKIASKPYSEPKPPSLEEILPHDDDLKEWLEITGYHNEPYRMKILNRRRAIAALDAQRNALLAEMEAEERGGAQAVSGIPATSSIMLRPQIPNTAGDRAVPLSKPTIAPQDTQHERGVSNKRAHSETQETREESNAKFARTNGRGSRIKQEDDDFGCPRSSSHGPSRRHSTDDRPKIRGSSRPRYEEDRGVRGRGSSRERDISPFRKAYESRPTPRSRGYDAGDGLRMRDRDEWEDRGRDRSDSRERGQFVVRGGYRGRAYDPSYRGRGRGGGRGRGDIQSHTEPRVDPGAFGDKIANGKPYKDTRGFDRGGKGETRYFIVESFNEEDVIRCIEDGIWTTQVQNGPVFKEAFESCKNVILIFSISKSRAFQGC